MGRKIVCILAILGIYMLVHAEPSEADIKLAAESEKYCASTESTKATPEMIMQKVNEAADIISKEGAACFRKFKGKNSKFIFAGTYMWINDMNGVMLMHPIKPGMESQNLIGLKDSNGKRFFVDMITVCQNKGEGWVDYMWPKPGEKDRSLKVSFVKKTICDGKVVVVGCGVYDMTLEQISAAMQKK